MFLHGAQLTCRESTQTFCTIASRTRPVAQKKRRLGEEKRKATKEETNKLLTADFIKELQYPTWLANVIMVRKPNGKWWMCTDYIDLNKACPNDPYPLPNIDRLVDSASSCKLLSFMDAYSRYNQIRMHPHDEAKTTFIRDTGTFYYKVMSFSLKNAVATYQRLMDRIFKDVMGHDMEAYIDNMKHQLKLNLEKCSFGVQDGKFLEYMLTERGIEANPEKCQAVINMRSPRNVKEVQ
ncbi:hypothetical protein CR513_44905, partial [Mucuna pruriens]